MRIDSQFFLGMVHSDEWLLSNDLMIPYTEFNLKYNTEITAATYADWVSIAEVRALVFPPQFRTLAAEFYQGLILCQTSSDRQTSEIKSFEIKPEGYSVSYADGAPKCDQWVNKLKQLEVAAGIELAEFKKVTTLGGDRTETFLHEF